MSLSNIHFNEYVRRSALEIETARFVESEKTLEVLLLENLKGIADCEFYYDSQHETTTYVIYLNKHLSYEVFND